MIETAGAKRRSEKLGESEIQRHSLRSPRLSAHQTASSTKKHPFFQQPASALWVENATAHKVPTIGSTASGSGIVLTNCLLISVTNGFNSYTFTGGNNYTNLNDTGIFQTVGAATHYLASGSSNRNVGTTNINATLLSELKKRTTYPPIVIGDGGYFTNSLTLYPQAQRDTDTPDLGYHYDPLDYVFNSVVLTNASITAMPGVAIGVRTLHNVGLGLLSGSAFTCEGTADNLNRFVRYNTVQEQSNTNWTEYAGGAYALGISWSTAITSPVLRLRFTEFSVPASTSESHFHLYGFSGDGGSHTIRDCQFNGGDVWSERPTFNITNCLFNRTKLWILESAGSMNFALRNSTFVGSQVELFNNNTGSWVIKDNLFDNTFSYYTEGTFTHNYNAYTTNAYRLTPNGANDVKLSVTNVTYATGRLGSFYLPTNLTSHSTLFNTGSWNATNAGLYHYTTTTNQFRETNSVVDLGFHYVAVNSSGVPIDTDSDGVPDYLEDINGNGSLDSGETDRSTANDWGLRVYITRPKNGSNIP